MAHVRQPFAVSAPGKVIVFGEHAVVHGRPAIAAALSLRSYLLVSSNSPPDESLTLDFPDVALHHTWPIKDLPWALFATKAVDFRDRLTGLDTDLVAAIQPFLDPISPGASDHVRRVHKHAAMAFLYILLSLESPLIVPRTYTLRSTIPIASGLGSSASVSVCLSTAILAQIGQIPLGIKPNDSDCDGLLDLINNWAFVGELCIHGNPSGIDNTVATRGKAVWFKRNPPPAGPSVSLLHDFPTLPLLLVDTKQPRSTAIEVAKVKKLMDDVPEVAECALDAIGKVTSSVLAMISEGHFERNQAASMDKLGQLITMNHGLLATFGVSHPRLERVREIVDVAEAGWTKLTGGGGGGCAFSLLNPRASAETLSSIESALDAEGFQRFETLLGAPGVGVLDLAQLPESLATRDMNALRGAQDSKAIEALMGIAAPDTAKYWQFFGP